MSEDLIERIRNAPLEFVAVEEELPDAWHRQGYPQNRAKLADYRFKVRLFTGVIYWSNFVGGEWSIIMKNPKFIVTHWVKPIWIG